MVPGKCDLGEGDFVSSPTLTLYSILENTKPVFGALHDLGIVPYLRLANKKIAMEKLFPIAREAF